MWCLFGKISPDNLTPYHTFPFLLSFQAKIYNSNHRVNCYPLKLQLVVYATNNETKSHNIKTVYDNVFVIETKYGKV